jgi:hypothetical protein
MFDKIYFSAGGPFALYNHFGAIKELHTEYNKPDSKLSRNIIFYGNSAGSFAALCCYLVFENLIHIDKLSEIVNTIDSKYNMINLNLTPMTIDTIDRIFEYCPADLHARVSNIIHIGVTTKNGYKLISQFDSNADIYNAILCSCTVPGLSNYDSKIGGELCIDGVFSLNSKYIPADAINIKLRIFSGPLTLTIPPFIIQQSLIEIGKQTVVDYMNNPKLVSNTDYVSNLRMSDILGLLLIHSLMYKNPMWKKHIESKTNSRISDNATLNIGLFDIINYANNTILNHSH